MRKSKRRVGTRRNEIPGWLRIKMLDENPDSDKRQSGQHLLKNDVDALQVSCTSRCIFNVRHF